MEQLSASEPTAPVNPSLYRLVVGLLGLILLGGTMFIGVKNGTIKLPVASKSASPAASTSAEDKFQQGTPTVCSGQKTYTDLNEALQNVSSVCALDLSNQQLASFPGDITKLTNLQRLDLRKNILTEIPGSINALSKLVYLFLGSNKLTSLPDQVGDLKQLRAIGLTDNQLKSLPSSLSKITNLTEIFIAGNPLTPDDVKKIHESLPTVALVQ